MTTDFYTSLQFTILSVCYVGDGYSVLYDRYLDLKNSINTKY